MSSRLAAYAVCIDDGRVLLAHHVTGNWTLPGGRVQHAEDPFDAVIREVAEETGCEAVVERLLGVDSRVVPAAVARAGVEHQNIGVFYRVRITGGRLRPEPNGETVESVWTMLPDVARLRRSSLVDTGLALAQTGPATGHVASVPVGGLIEHRSARPARAVPLRAAGKCVPLKLSQGAEPGIGGVLPGSKANAEIAAVRGVPEGRTVVSPPYHQVFSTPRELVRSGAWMRDLTGGDPAGFKPCVGFRQQPLAVCKAVAEKGRAPDFIIVDGAEDGTGAAPLEFADRVRDAADRGAAHGAQRPGRHRSARPGARPVRAARSPPAPTW